MCNEPMRELSNPGASGSVFYVSDNDDFLVKTVQHSEADFLQKLLPGYFMVSSLKLYSQNTSPTVLVRISVDFMLFSCVLEFESEPVHIIAKVLRPLLPSGELRVRHMRPAVSQLFVAARSHSQSDDFRLSGNPGPASLPSLSFVWPRFPID